MISISKDDIKKYKDNGWVQVSLGLSSHSIQKYFNSVQKLEEKAISIQYPMGRTYYPFIFDKNKAALETPFNKLIINEGIKSLFEEIKLGNAVCNLMGWEKAYCHLARLFTMNNHKYRGHWHRDFTEWDGGVGQEQCVQVAVYLQDQDGFRLLKNEYDLWGSNKIPDHDDFEQSVIPLDIDKKYYDSIEGKAGSVLFFAPGKLHQGGAFDKRLDFHMRFTAEAYFPTKNQAYKFGKNSFQDFYCRDVLAFDANHTNDLTTPRIGKIKSLVRIKNSINYYSGAWNFTKILQYFYKYGKHSAPWKFDFFSNTIFQKK